MVEVNGAAGMSCCNLAGIGDYYLQSVRVKERDQPVDGRREAGKVALCPGKGGFYRADGQSLPGKKADDIEFVAAFQVIFNVSCQGIRAVVEWYPANDISPDSSPIIINPGTVSVPSAMVSSLAE